VTGSLVETLIKAYGVGAAVSVALSDAETVGGKASDAVRAVPNLAEEYRDAQYVVGHRDQIQTAITYLNEHTLPQEELQRSADESVATLGALETTYTELAEARSVLEIDGFSGTLTNVRAAIDHVGNASSARPDLDSIQQLAAVAEQVRPFADHVDVLIPVYYGHLLAVTDNFAGDEIMSTLVVMGAALGLAVVLGQAVGFWIRRGRTGLLARLLQRLGARTFRPWYVSNLPYALSPPLYDAAREHLQREIVADPEAALAPETLTELEEWFAKRAAGITPAAVASSPAPRPR
jgi:hypothetical protein